VNKKCNNRVFIVPGSYIVMSVVFVVLLMYLLIYLNPKQLQLVLLPEQLNYRTGCDFLDADVVNSVRMDLCYVFLLPNQMR